MCLYGSLYSASTKLRYIEITSWDGVNAFCVQNKWTHSIIIIAVIRVRFNCIELMKFEKMNEIGRSNAPSVPSLCRYFVVSRIKAPILLLAYRQNKIIVFMSHDLMINRKDDSSWNAEIDSIVCLMFLFAACYANENECDSISLGRRRLFVKATPTYDCWRCPSVHAFQHAPRVHYVTY